VARGPDAMWSCLFDGRARLGISLALLAPEMSTSPTLTSQGELFDAAVASVYVTLCSSVGTSLLLCIQAPADNIKNWYRKPGITGMGACHCASIHQNRSGGFRGG
jgi:hypothetical protein